MPAAAIPPHANRAIAGWLYVVAALVLLMVIVGGSTRLTNSGLSIVEWKPVTGAIPPLSEAAWQAEFDKYKTIPQFQQLNKDMDLGGFKFIYLWEWGHRLLGRLVGAVFFLPFVVFLARGWVEPRLKPRLWGLFALGGAQGAVGWWMVTSGFVDRVHVSQYRLATHLTFACAILIGLLWTARGLKPRATVARGVLSRAHLIVALVLAQIFLGGLVAGLHAGLVHNTWPLMGEGLVPPLADLTALTPLWRNFFENETTVQFVHRLGAYLVMAATAWHAFASRGTEAGRGAVLVMMLAWGQAVLGIATLLAFVPLHLALAHQALAVIVLWAASLHAAGLAGERRQLEAAAAVTA